MLLVLFYYLARINKLNREIKESENIIQIIINELKQRLYSQDQKLLDFDVKLNIIDLRINKFPNLDSNKIINKLANINDKPLVKMISQKELLLTETEKKILENLSFKDYTANELQLLLNKTREHTSRLLNKLFVEGYITRDNSKKPFVYKLLNINNAISE
jgi:hypothetical protein|tara:strand:- start:766 stop:1245 length:480 start_codon:yes stop_codon:yes gene_type:complete